MMHRYRADETLVDLFIQSADASPAVAALDQLNATWIDTFVDPDSGIDVYGVCVGQKGVVDNCDNFPWTAVGRNVSLRAAVNESAIGPSLLDGPVCVRVFAVNEGNVDSWTAEVRFQGHEQRVSCVSICLFPIVHFGLLATLLERSD